MTKRTCGFHLFRENQHGSEYIRCRLLVREDDAESPINPRSGGESAIWDAPKRFDGYCFDGFEINGFYSERDSDLGLIAVGPEFRDVYHADAPCVAAMHKTIIRAIKAMRRAEARDPGDIYSAVAKSLGLSFAVEKIENPNGGMTYRDHHWNWMSIEEGRNALRRMIAAAIKKNDAA